MDREVLKQISERYETPAYVFDLDMLRERIRMMEGILGRAQICFAMKANPFLVQCRELGISKYEVCSPGEFHICERAGVSPEKIVLSGVYKVEEDVRHTIELCGNKATYTDRIKITSGVARASGKGERNCSSGIDPGNKRQPVWGR